MALIRLLYRSDSELTGSPRAVRDAAFSIADASRIRNQAEGVSGALMFIGGVFVQLLEGENVAVEAVFERICGDFRHRRLLLLDYSEVSNRMFDEGMVAFEGDDGARELFPSITEASSFARVNRMSANTAVDWMRALLTKRETRAVRPLDNRLIATNILD